MKAQNIAELLTHRLYIPEIQREYVWGAEGNIEKLIRFVDDVVNAASQSKDKNVGFLYSYDVRPINNGSKEDSKNESTENSDQSSLLSEHYIIDGQQRFTTLVLLLYVVALREEKLSDFQKKLNSDEPTIQFSYNVRPLTEHFFRLLINQNKCKQHIKENIWYTKSFDRDMTIISMVNAIAKIDAYLEARPQFNGLFESILQHVQFWYFDVNQTSQGEELYITMNSRGEKLTESEQIKPHLFGKLQKDEVNYYGKLWDDWEEFFFKHRPTDCGDQAIRYVDIAMNNFIRIVSELLSIKEQNEIVLSEKLSLPELEQWFKTLERIPEDEIFQREINRLYEPKEDSHFLVLKSLLVTAMRQPEDQREYFRVRATMRNNVIRRKVTKHIALLRFLNEYRTAPQRSFYEFVLSSDIQDVLAPNETQKIQILFDTKSSEIEEAFWKDEHHSIWSGDINPLIKWATDDSGIFSFDKYLLYSKKFNELFCLKVHDIKDSVRRALVTQKLNDYPGYYRSRINLSFAYEPEDWKFLIDINLEKFKSFFNDLLQGKTLQQMIADFDQAEKWSEFAKQPYLMKYCHEKNIQWYHKEGWLLIPGKKATTYMSVKNLHLYHYLNQLMNIVNWEIGVYDHTDAHVIKVENYNKNFVFDMWYREPQASKWILTFFRRNAEIESSLLPYIDNTWHFNGERYEKSLEFFDSGDYSYPNVLEELTTIINKIDGKV